MRLLFKILLLPIILITWILYGVCRLIVLASGVLLGILSGMALIAAGVLFFRVGILPGAAVLMIAFLITGILSLAPAVFGGSTGMKTVLTIIDIVSSLICVAAYAVYLILMNKAHKMLE